MQKKYDRQIFILTLFLTIFGVIVIAGASSPIAERDFLDKFYFAKQQAVWAFIGTVLLVVVSNIKYKFWEKFATILFFVTVLSLFAVLIPGVGISALGAQRRLYLGPISFQPSEFLKLTLAIYMAKVAAKKKKFASFLFPLGLSVVLIMLQPDLGTSLIVVAIGVTQMFISGVNIFYFISFVALGILGGAGLILFSDYRKERLLTYLQQTRDPLGASYHIRQVLIALGSGGLLGVGFGNSRQKYLYLPETATDSIFAIIGEELGFLGGALLICIFGYFVFRGLRVAMKAPDDFSKVLASGIVAWIGGQAFLNISSMVSLTPLTGIPLPFISYGGSSIMAILIGCGVLLNISRYGKEK